MASFSTSGLAVFGGQLRSANHVAGVSGWRLTAAGNAELNKLVVRDSIVVGAVSDTWAASKLPDFNNTPTNTEQLVLTLGATGPQDFVMISCSLEFLTAGNASFSMRFSLEGYDGATWTVLSEVDVTNGNTFWRSMSRAMILAGGYENARVRAITRNAGGSIRNLRLFARRVVV